MVHDWLLGRKASEPLDGARGASKPVGARRGAVVLETTEALGDTRQNEEAYFATRREVVSFRKPWKGAIYRMKKLRFAFKNSSVKQVIYIGMYSYEIGDIGE